MAENTGTELKMLLRALKRLITSYSCSQERIFDLEKAYPFGGTGRLTIPSEPPAIGPAAARRERSKAAVGRDQSHAQAWLSMARTHPLTGASTVAC
jgi:hypothetical protein